MLPSAAMGLAEDFDSAEAEVYFEEAPVTEEPTVEEPPAEQPPAEEVPTEQPPAENPPAGEDPVFETPGGSVSEWQEDGTGAEQAETTEPPAYVEREEITDETDLTTVMAVGSNGIQYAGVAYLSVAAFQSLGANAQIDYIQAANQVASLLESGVGITNVVFFLNEDGSLGFTCTYPMEPFYSEDQSIAPADEALEAFAEASEARTSDFEQPVSGDALVEESEAPISENVELAESLDIPIESIPRRTASIAYAASTSAVLSAVSQEYAAGQVDTLFWKQKNYFYNQLSANAKKYYEAIYQSVIVDGQTGFSINTTSAYNATYVCDALSALINAYPNKFDWCDVAYGWQGSWTLSSGQYEIKIAFVISPHYSAKLDQDAQNKVNSVVSAAYTYAQQNYGNYLVYGIVRYFDNWLCTNNYYENIGASTSYTSTSTYYYCHTSYGCLLKGYGVCESYARAMSSLLDAAGIPNLYAVGTGNGGGHAWNYVQMPDGRFYLQDSTWNDTTAPSHNYSTYKWLLIGSSYDASAHRPQGRRFAAGSYFSFPSPSGSSYLAQVEAFNLNKSTVNLTQGSTTTLSLNDGGYYKSLKKDWSSSNASVAKVDQNGKVTAVAPGEATITLTVGSSASSGYKTLKCTVYVYKASKLTFNENGKTTYIKTQTANPFKSEMVFLTLSLQGSRNAQQMVSAGAFKEPKVTCGKKSVATATVTLAGNMLILNITPTNAGNTDIQISFGGKTATLTYKVRKQILASWFELKRTSFTYNGTACKPAVVTTSSAPLNPSYKVFYANNKKVGTATVTITGTGNYGGTVTKTFSITQASIANATVSNPKSKTYNGSAEAASVTVKVDGRTLKAGTDYNIYYNGSLTAPTKPGTYNLRLQGIGNYTDTYAGAQRTYTITPTPITSVDVTMNGSVKYTGSSVTAASLNLKVKVGSKELPASDYTITYKYPDGNTYAQAPYAKGSYKLILTPNGSNVLATDEKATIVKSFTIM